MRLVLACVAALALAIGIADAAPRDLVAVTGTITHQSRGQFMVLHADDGRTYYVDLSSADRSEPTRKATDRPVTVIGAEGARSDEIVAYVIDVFDNKPRVLPGYTDAPGVAFQRVRGTVESVSGTTARVKSDEGRTVSVNLIEMDQRDAVRPGERVTMVGRVEGGTFRAFWARPRESDTFSAAPTERDEPGRWRRLHGTVESRQGAQMTFRADGGRAWNVDLGHVPDDQRRGLERGKAVTIAGFPESRDRFLAHYVAPDDGREPGRQAGLPPRGTEIILVGQTTSFEGRAFRFVSIDGQLMIVDSSKVSDGEHRLLALGHPVTVRGVRGQGNTIVAHEVSRDERHSRRPPDQVDPGAQKLETIHGAVQSVAGGMVKLRSDAGRNVTLDITAVRDTVSRQLTPGDKITATGFYGRENPSLFSVRSLREEGGAGSTAPGTTTQAARPASKDECMNGGWQKFTDPAFKNQGDCVSWTNRPNKK